MDKVKITLAILKKYHFWVLCGLIILTSLGISVIATADLTAQLEARTQELNASFSSVERICSVSPHPNQKVIDAKNSETEQLKQDVFVAWKTLYQDQTDKNQLADALTEEFKREFYRGGELSWEHREVYRTFIHGRFDMLFNDILDVYRPVSGAPASLKRKDGGTQPIDPTEPMTGVVMWEERFELKSRFKWPNRPTTEHVRMAQEDLWVYEALLRVIRDTNVDPAATEPIGHHNAAVREIVSLKIGSETFGSSGDASLDELMPKSRYVNQNGQAIAAGAAEYNIMPILMLVSLDQSKIPKLLAECGNSNMPIEIRNVRIRPGHGTGLNLGAIAPASVLATTRNGSGGDLPTGATYIPVEIHGLIYIYNPPDSTKLGTEALAEAPDTTPEVETQPTTDTTPEPSPEPSPEPGPAPTPAAPGGPAPVGAPVADPMQE